MVSLWPWKGEDNSPASFEKTLSNLSAKITQTTTQLDNHRQHARRFKALWTLYTTFAYLLYSIILALILGWQNWGITEYAAVAGGPVLIFAVRAAASKYFDFLIAKTQRYLETLQKERDETIEKLKAATKYNSTQQLLEKYGGETPDAGKSKDEKQKSDVRRKPTPQQQQQQQEPVARTGLPPPPTANIRRPSPQTPQTPHTPHTPQQNLSPSPYPAESPRQPQPQSRSPQAPSPLEEPGFAPNAFPSTPQYIEQSHWYDRLLDVLLGEDETQPKNRIALICNTCRLVNGQAPPGIKALEAVGRWRCGSCGAWNGEESETTKVLANIRRRSAERVSGSKADEADNQQSSPGDGTDDGVIVAGGEEDGFDTDAEVKLEPETTNAPVLEETDPEPSSRTTRSRSKASKSKG
ncbi:hypothetical protein PHISP_00094 [Aspergillus sp. HF37]|nr:hypothetical protein PHISP_00094 [Aspergillus sp. HF37]